MSTEQQWAIEDHLCVNCGGRILRCIKGAGPTPGGNPLYRCSDCGAQASSHSPSKLCWCGMTFKGQTITAYQCVPFSIIQKHPKMLDAFLSCGCDPKRKTNEVGIVTVDAFKKATAEV